MVHEDRLPPPLPRATKTAASWRWAAASGARPAGAPATSLSAAAICCSSRLPGERGELRRRRRRGPCAAAGDHAVVALRRQRSAATGRCAVARSLPGLAHLLLLRPRPPPRRAAPPRPPPPQRSPRSLPLCDTRRRVGRLRRGRRLRRRLRRCPLRRLESRRLRRLRRRCRARRCPPPLPTPRAGGLPRARRSSRASAIASRSACLPRPRRSAPWPPLPVPQPPPPRRRTRPPQAESPGPTPTPAQHRERAGSWSSAAIVVVAAEPCRRIAQLDTLALAALQTLSKKLRPLRLANSTLPVHKLYSSSLFDTVSRPHAEPAASSLRGAARPCAPW